MLSVAIVDHHPVQRAGLEKLLSEHAGLAVVAAARCAEDLRTGGVPVDVALLDVPVRGGRPALAAIELAAARWPVVVSSAWERPLTFGAVLRTGVRGYVASHSDPQSIVS